MASSKDVVEILFNGRKEALRVISSGDGDHLARYLARDDNEICPLIGSKIKLGKELGSGTYGTVFDIEIPGQGQKMYVVKNAEVEVDSISYDKDDFVTDSLQGITDLSRVPDDEIGYVLKLNGMDRYTKVPDEGITIKIPKFLNGDCRKAGVSYMILDTNEAAIVPSKSVVCDDESITEFAISLLMGDLYRSGKSINFIDAFYFATCFFGDPDKTQDIARFTFMEKIDFSMRDLEGCLSEYTKNALRPSRPYTSYAAECILIQAIHAIGVYQKAYRIVHGDLYLANLFIEFVTPDTAWNGVKVLDVDLYEYRVGDKSIYLPGGKLCPFIAKIGDMGLAVRYGSDDDDTKGGPILGPWSVVEDGVDQGDGKGPWLPNFYTPAYDVILLIRSMWKDIAPSNERIKAMLAWCFGLKPGYSAKRFASETKMASTGRPTIGDLRTKHKHVTPEAILLNPELMGPYLVAPPAGAKVLLMGEF